MNAEVSHLFTDNNACTDLDVQEYLRIRETNAREDRYLSDHNRLLERAKNVTEKQYRYLTRNIRGELKDITTKTPSLDKTVSSENIHAPLTTKCEKMMLIKESKKATNGTVFQAMRILPAIGKLSDDELQRNKISLREESESQSNSPDTDETMPSEFFQTSYQRNIKFTTKHFLKRVTAINRTLKALESKRKLEEKEALAKLASLEQRQTRDISSRKPSDPHYTRSAKLRKYSKLPPIK